MRGREVFPLQTCGRKFLLHRANELIDEIEVRLSRNALVTPAEVLRIVKTFLVFGSPSRTDGECAFRTNATDERI
jgi:hypothetical protein